MVNGDIVVDDKQVRAWLKKVENPRSVFVNVLTAIGVKGTNIVKVKGRLITASGTFVASVDYILHGTEAVEIRIDNEQYGHIAFETGRAPGKQPPVKALRFWAGKRGIPQDKIFAIAKSIAKKGTQKYRSGGPKLKTESVKDLEKELGNILNELDKFYATN